MRIACVARACALVGAAVLLISSPVWAADKCTDAQAAAADRWLWLNVREKQNALKEHLPWGVPKADQAAADERLLVQRDYVIEHDDDLRIPLWTATKVVAAKLGKVKRLDCFRADVRLPASAAATDDDYKEPIFDQGHMTPFADQSMNLTAELNSFIMSNMTPQFCQFNRGTWQILETLVRRWAKVHGTVYVISGSVLDRNNDGRRDPDAAAIRMKPNHGERRVAIPSAFYKIIAYEEPAGRINTLTLLIPHDQTDVDRADAIEYLKRGISNISTIEQLTGLTFFPDAASMPVEAANLWSFPGAPPTSLARTSPQCTRTAGAVIVLGDDQRDPPVLRLAGEFNR